MCDKRFTDQTVLILTPSLCVSDEVGALVFDIGSFSTRAGYAGEDCPKVTTLSVCLYIHPSYIKLLFSNIINYLTLSELI